jgi:hypothetical protein
METGKRAVHIKAFSTGIAPYMNAPDEECMNAQVQNVTQKLGRTHKHTTKIAFNRG